MAGAETGVGPTRRSWARGVVGPSSGCSAASSSRDSGSVSPTRGGAPWRSTDSTPGMRHRVDGLHGGSGGRAERYHDAVVPRDLVQEPRGEAPVRRRDPLDLVHDVGGGADREVVAELVGERRRDRPVGPGEPGRCELLAEAGHAALDVGGRAGPLVRHGDRQDDIGLVERGPGVTGHGDDELGSLERPLGQRTVREVLERVTPEQHERPRRALLALGERSEGVGRVAAPSRRNRAPAVAEPPLPLLDRGAAGEDPGRHAHVERALHVAAAQEREELRLRPGRAQCGDRRRRHRRVLGQRGPRVEHHDARPARAGLRDEPACRLEVVAGERRAGRMRGERRLLAGQRPGHQGRIARAHGERDRGVAGERGGSGRQLDQGRLLVEHGAAQPEKEDRELLTHVGREQHDQSGRAGLVDRRPRQREHELGGQAVADLRVDRVGADDPLRELRPARTRPRW